MHLLILGAALVFVVMSQVMPMAPTARPVLQPMLWGVALLFVVLAFSFKTLTVEDAGDHLFVHYGPLPVFRKRFPYSQITGAKRSRSRFVDGWGIHCVLGRGWTWNLWGFDCVEMRVKGTTYRIGTDDAEELTRFLQACTR